MPTSAGEIVAGRRVVTYFQPIFSAKQKSVIGVEALSRGVHPDNGQLIPPVELFRLAATEHLDSAMEQLCQETAIETFAGLSQEDANLILFLNFGVASLDAGPASDGGLLFLNVNPSLVAQGGDDETADALADRAIRAGLDPRRIALEVLESRFDDSDRLRSLFDALRRRGFLLVLDDMGAGHSNLDRIPLVRPDIIKVDRSLVRQINTDYHRQETFKSLCHLARKIGSLVVAEGVETQPEAIVALELGADLLQGFYLARPMAAEQLASPPTDDSVSTLAREYKRYMVGKINARKLQHRRYTIIINEILCELARTSVQQFDSVLREIIRRYPNVEALYVLDESGTQISDTVCTFVGEQQNRLMFRPAQQGTDHSLKEFYYMLLDVELQKYTTDPYVSLASGNVCRTISTCFRDVSNSKMYIICIDVVTT